jgi:hypothetical protein
MRWWLRAGAVGFVAWVLSCVAAPTPCAARARGIAARSCNGCHNGGAEPQVRLMALTEGAPGQALRLLLEIETKNGPTAGFYLTADEGSLSAVSGQGAQVFADGGLAHSSPKQGSGFVQFELDWTAPADPTGVVFEVWAVSANDNDRSTGDAEGSTTLTLAVGCDGLMYFRDTDRDGYGSAASGIRLDCEPRDGYATLEGDCDQNNADINPSADEYCNERDDDCDDLIDEGSLPQAHYPDPDGDGHGQPGSESTLECPPPPAHAPTDDDCAEGDPTAHPGATEICDGHDNDCNGQSDERVKPTCGVGWCRRESWSCDVEDCEPGEPREELCNAFDEDCDDVLDEGAECEGGLVCQEGVCVVAGGAGRSGAGSSEAGRGSAGQQGVMPAEPTAEPQSPVEVDAGSAKPAPSDAGCAVSRIGTTPWSQHAAFCAVALSLLSRRRRSSGVRSLLRASRSALHSSPP